MSFILLGIVISSSTNAATVNPQRIIPGSYIVEFEDSDEVCLEIRPPGRTPPWQNLPLTLELDSPPIHSTRLLAAEALVQLFV